MIPFASQRGGGQDLATHLMNAFDNEIAEIAHIRGAVAADLHGAFKEWEVEADALTRCEKYLYSLSINPDPRQGGLTREQYMDYIARAETMLGLANQPRAVVFHTKQGREHCHVVWSRIDTEQGKAVHLAFDHEKLMRVTRTFARDHGIRLPPGYEKSRQAGQETLYEREQKRQSGLGKADHMRLVTEAWQLSDNPGSFVQALAERGYLLATGKRPYLLVDLYGNVNALPKLIDDKSVRTADIRAFLEKDYPPDSLPSAEEAQALVEQHRKLIEREVAHDQIADRLEELKHAQQERRAALLHEQDSLKRASHEARERQRLDQRAERDTLRGGYLKTVRDVRSARQQNRATGLAAFLGRVTGVERLRHALHRRADAKRLAQYGAELAGLKARQEVERTRLEQRLALQAKEAARKSAALERVDRREVAACLRDLRRDQRVRDRGDGDAMPSLAVLAGFGSNVPQQQSEGLHRAFDHASEQRPPEVPDVMSAFARAARGADEGERGDDAPSALDRATPSDPRAPQGPGKERGR